MNTSVIVFAGIIVCGIAALPLAFRGLHKLAKDFFHYQENKENKVQEQKIEESKEKLKETVDSGNLAELIDASKKLGESRRKKKQ